MDTKEKFLNGFIEQDASTSEYLSNIKLEAGKAIKDLEFPTTRDEFWKYTRLAKLLNNDFIQAPHYKITKADFQKYLVDNSDYLVFVNGFYSEELSDIRQTDVEIKPLAKSKDEQSELLENHYGQLTNHTEDIFSAINTFYATNGIALHLKKGPDSPSPIQVIQISNGTSISYNPRNLIVLEDNCKAELLFTRISLSGTAFTNCVSEIFLGENAQLDVVDWQNQGRLDYQISNVFIEQRSSSTINYTTITTGGLQIRNNIYVRLKGEHIQTYLNGLSLAKNNQHIDNHTIIDHEQPNCESFETYKGVARDKSTIVFNGKVFVRKDAQKTNAFQSNKNILLSDDANIYSKPELEIYADDVKCSHGSTTGQIDQEALFYLRSRGISAVKAKKIMIEAFAKEVLNFIKNEPFQNMVVETIEKNYFV